MGLTQGINLAIGAALAAMFLFVNIRSDQTEKYLKKEAENAQLKIDILLAQIQPHFLYNSLTVIKNICLNDPETAADAIDEFIDYLRHNMDSLSQDRPIGFEKELEHTRHYLDLQRLRFGDELQVEYDLGCTDFCLPALTLQPLVENAVTYGVRRSESGAGVVTVRTRQYPDRVEVSVIDDGPGFVPESLPGDAERSHAGLRNVRERLARIIFGC